MAKFVTDIKSHRWVVISSSRLTRPHDNVGSPVGTGSPNQCPFCPENDSLNTELYRVPESGPLSVRVIANKYPITDHHEVIIHSQDHNADFNTLPPEQINLILQTYRSRYLFHTQAKNGSVLIFNNHDIHAGASLKHPHSQVVVVPPQINLDTMSKEPLQNLVTEDDHFSLYCPDFSQWPYEIWIAPKVPGKNFGEITDDQIQSLGAHLKKTLSFIISKFSPPQNPADEVPYNYYIYHGQDWYLRIIPRLVHRAGFELGTGLSVNIVDPIQASQDYRAGIK